MVDFVKDEGLLLSSVVHYFHHYRRSTQIYIQLLLKHGLFVSCIQEQGHIQDVKLANHKECLHLGVGS